MAGGNRTPRLSQSEVDRRRGALGQVLFRRSLPEQGLRVSSHPALQWSFRVGHGRPSSVDVLVAAAADDQGLASSLGHEVHPGGFLPSSWLVQVCELADVVDLKALRVLAEFAAPGEEPVYQLVPLGAGHDGPLVGEGGCAHSPERYSAKTGDQWLPAPVALDGQLQALARPGGGIDDGLVLPGHLPDRRAVLAR